MHGTLRIAVRKPLVTCRCVKDRETLQVESKHWEDFSVQITDPSLSPPFLNAAWKYQGFTYKAEILWKQLLGEKTHVRATTLPLLIPCPWWEAAPGSPSFLAHNLMPSKSRTLPTAGISLQRATRELHHWKLLARIKKESLFWLFQTGGKKIKGKKSACTHT